MLKEDNNTGLSLRREHCRQYLILGAFIAFLALAMFLIFFLSHQPLYTAVTTIIVFITLAIGSLFLEIEEG